MSFNPTIRPYPDIEPLGDYEYLTQPLAPQDVEPLSAEEQVASAMYVAGALHAAIGSLHRQSRDTITKPNAIDFSNAWLPDIAHAIIRGRQITVEPAGAVITTGETPRPGLKPADRLSLGLAHLLRDIAPRERQIGHLTVIGDAYDHIAYDPAGQPGRIYNALYDDSVRQNHLLGLRDVFKNEGIISPTDQAGRDYSFISTGERLGLTDYPGGIVHDLRRSAWGTVEQSEDGDTYFKPSDELKSICFYDRRGIYSGNILLIDKHGVETNDALYADAVRGTLQRLKGLHIMGPNPNIQPASILLRAADVVNRQRYHAIDAEWDMVNPTTYALGVARQLQRHVHEFIANRNRFASFNDFNPYAYVERHYGEEQAAAEDQDICRVVAFALNKLGVRAQKAVDIGCGPNPYPAMLLLPHAEKVDLLEYSRLNRDYMQGFFSGTLSHNQIEIWRKYATHMVEGGGDAYVGVFDAVREAGVQRRITTEYGDIFKLPQDTWDLISAYFVVDSISIYREDQHDAVASMKQALTDEGVMVTGNMLNDKDHIGYPAGEDQEYPNISQTIQQLKQTYVDNNLHAVVVKVARGPKKVRDGYSGMALVFACHKDADRVQALKDLAQELERLKPGCVI